MLLMRVLSDISTHLHIVHIYGTCMMHDDKYRCLNVRVTAKMQFYHLSQIEKWDNQCFTFWSTFPINNIFSFCNFSDLIHFVHETWLHHTLLCPKIFQSNRLQWDCLKVSDYKCGNWSKYISKLFDSSRWHWDCLGILICVVENVWIK